MSLADIKSKVVSGVNPDHPQLGTSNNCLRCSYAYEMRRRGFDVSATKTMMAVGQTKGGTRRMIKDRKNEFSVAIKAPSPSKLHRVFKGNKPDTKRIFDTIGKQPNGARGEFQMSWGFGVGGHSIAYEIVNNKPVFIDAQTSKTYSTPIELDTLVNKAKGFKYTRLDNKDLSKYALASWIKDA